MLTEQLLDQPIVETTAPEPGSRWRDQRVQKAPLIAVAMCALTFAVLLTKVSRLDFYYDEWDFVDKASHWSLRDYFVPHNEHWSTVPMILYRVMLGIDGMHSYLLFSGTLILAHVVVAYLVFLIVRRRSGDVLALAALVMTLLLGRGYDDIIWAFQIGFTASVLFGLLALNLFAEDSGPRRTAMGSAALVLSLASSGIGLFFVVAAAVQLLLARRPWKRLVLTFAVPMTAYALWYTMFGMQNATVHRSPLSATAAQGLVTFLPTGVGAGTAGVFGLAARWSQIGLVIFVVTLMCVVRRRDPKANIAIAAAVAAIVQFSLTALVRAQFGDGLATTSRYVYIAGILFLLMLTEAVGDLPWRRVWPLGLAVVVAVSALNGYFTLSRASHERVIAFDHQRAELATVWYFRDAPGLDRGLFFDPVMMPTLTASQYFQTRADFGSPVGAVDQAGLDRLDPASMNLAMRHSMPLRIVAAAAAQDPGPGRCYRADKAADAVFSVPGGSTLTIRAADGDGAAADIGYWYLDPEPKAADVKPVRVAVDAGMTVKVTVPDTGKSLSWHVRVADATPGSAITVCGA